MSQSHLTQVYGGNATTIRLSPCPLCVTCSCNAILHVISLYCILVFQPLFLSASFPQCTPLHSFTLVQICDNWLYNKCFHKNLNTIFQSNAQFFVHLKMVSKHALKNLSFISWDWKSIMIMSRIIRRNLQLDIYTIKIVGPCMMIMSITPYLALVQISPILDLHPQY